MQGVASRGPMFSNFFDAKDFQRKDTEISETAESGRKKGKLLIDSNDPLVLPCIDENSFIRALGGSMTSSARHSSQLS